MLLGDRMIPNSYRTQLPCRGCEKYNGTTVTTSNATVTGATVAGCPHISCPYESQFEYTFSYTAVPEPPKLDKPRPTNLQKQLQKQAFRAIQNSHKRK